MQQVTGNILQASRGIVLGAREAGRTASRDITCSENILTDLISESVAIYVAGTTNAIITRNQITNSPQHGIGINDAARGGPAAGPCTVTENRVNNAIGVGHGIWVTVANCTIANNQLSAQAAGLAIEANGTKAYGNRLKGGFAGERSERTLDASEHDATLRTIEGLLRYRNFVTRRSLPTNVSVYGASDAASSAADPRNVLLNV